ncbi:MAG TPA: glutathione S-transferase family protein [Sphingomicrobium sp.]|nr:glutathione S-transferase family protein [Sphingomicrobium sp.]
MNDQLVLHEYSPSGNCYKVRLTAAMTGKKLQRREYDILKGETRTPEFLAKINSNGRIPVLQVGDRFIPESNAASYYVAEGSHLIPTDPFDHADMLRWMFWEQYSHEPNIATLRFWMRELGPDGLSDLQRLQMPGKRQQGNAALKLMDEHLGGRDWFVGDSISLADICLFAYTHVAGDADFDLQRYSNVLAWIQRVKAEPRYVDKDA